MIRDRRGWLSYEGAAEGLQAVVVRTGEGIEWDDWPISLPLEFGAMRLRLDREEKSTFPYQRSFTEMDRLDGTAEMRAQLNPFNGFETAGEFHLERNLAFVDGSVMRWYRRLRRTRAAVRSCTIKCQPDCHGAKTCSNHADGGHNPRHGENLLWMPTAKRRAQRLICVGSIPCDLFPIGTVGSPVA